MKKYLYILPVLFMATACSHDVVTTAHDFEVRLVGTDAAYCILSTRDNRYTMAAPGKTLVERDQQDLKVDCKDNLSARRRTLFVQSEFSLGYWTYPQYVTVNFASTASKDAGNGFRLDPDDVMVKEVLTEDSYSSPVVEKTQLEKDLFDSEVPEDIIVVESTPSDFMLDDNIKELKEIEMHSLRKIHKEKPYLKNNGRRSYPVQLD